MQTPNSLGIGDGKAPGFFVVVGDMERLVVCQCGLAAGNVTSC
ncbi:hypothetical protein [Dialister succinatiphilus]|nr:hypothetical protein [Dialister succinatiphilus]